MPRKLNTETDLVVSGGAAPVRKKPARPRAKRAGDPVETLAAAAPDLAAPPYEEIAALAYSYWEARGYQDGSPEEDWLRAEEELRSRANATAATA